MARKIIESITDDFDGTEGASSVSFAFDGKSYEIDLTSQNKAKLADALAPFIVAGRVVSSSRRAAVPRAVQKYDLNDVREWARANGHRVSDRGRVAATVLEAYDAAH